MLTDINMDDYYFVVRSGKPLGPFSIEEMKGMQITPDTFVKTSKMSDYKEAHEIPMLCDALGFTLEKAQAQYFASPDMRLLAAVIDYLLLLFIYLILIVTIIKISDSQSQYLRVAVSVSFLPVIPMIKFFMNVFMEASKRQGTFGKSWLGIKVTTEEANPLNFKQSFYRNSLKLLCVLSLGIGYLAGFFNRRQQCWHDRIAKTLVVKDRLI